MNFYLLSFAFLLLLQLVVYICGLANDAVQERGRLKKAETELKEVKRALNGLVTDFDRIREECKEEASEDKNRLEDQVNEAIIVANIAEQKWSDAKKF